MTNIIVISATTREGRKSHTVAQYVVEQLNLRETISAQVLNVKALNLPLMEYKFDQHPNPTQEMENGHVLLDNADAFLIVSPEYNGGAPGSLKNTMDYYYKEYNDKAFGIVSVSSGQLGGMRVGLSLRQQAMNYGGIVLPRVLSVANVDALFNEQGTLLEKSFETKTEVFLDKFLWLTHALLK